MVNVVVDSDINVTLLLPVLSVRLHQHRVLCIGDVLYADCCVYRSNVV